MKSGKYQALLDTYKLPKDADYFGASGASRPRRRPPRPARRGLLTWVFSTRPSRASSSPRRC
ncbi:hypothetical protein NKH77_49760 [Streptomyces sp. M19]